MLLQNCLWKLVIHWRAVSFALRSAALGPERCRCGIGDIILAELPDDACLTEYQVGAAIQVSTNSLSSQVPFRPAPALVGGPRWGIARSDDRSAARHGSNIEVGY
jgi:hypothetical protein